MEMDVKARLELVMDELDQGTLPKWQASSDTYLADLFDDSTWQHDVADHVEAMGEPSSKLTSEMSTLSGDLMDMYDEGACSPDEAEAIVSRIERLRGSVDGSYEEAVRELDAAASALDRFVDDARKEIDRLRGGLRDEFSHYSDGIESALGEARTLLAEVEEGSR